MINGDFIRGIFGNASKSMDEFDKAFKNSFSECSVEEKAFLKKKVRALEDLQKKQDVNGLWKLHSEVSELANNKNDRHSRK